MVAFTTHSREYYRIGSTIDKITIRLLLIRLHPKFSRNVTLTGACFVARRAATVVRCPLAFAPSSVCLVDTVCAITFALSAGTSSARRATESAIISLTGTVTRHDG